MALHDSPVVLFNNKLPLLSLVVQVAKLQLAISTEDPEQIRLPFASQLVVESCFT